MPETQALMRVLDSVQPQLMCSLHNSEFGGAFYYLSEEMLGLAETSSNLVRQTEIPLHTGDAEIPGAVRSSSPGVFSLPSRELSTRR